MAVFNSFPTTYQPYYPINNYQPQQTQQQVGTQMSLPQQPVNNGIIWVSGEAGAKAYLVAPNTTVQLWDSESQTIYLKSADASGMPSMKYIDYTIRDANPPVQTVSVNEDKYISKDELKAVKGQISALYDEIEKLKPRNKGGKKDE